MKKLISMAVAAAMSLSMAAAVNAEDNPKVYIDNTQISFNDQQPVILGEGTTLVPARGVFEAMGASVDWYDEIRTVQIDSEDNITRIFLNIDDPVMKVYTFTSIFSSEESLVKLDVAPQIINDRTMIPLRAISEAIGADVKWDGDAYSVLITTKNYEQYIPSADPDAPADANVKTGISITSSVDSVSEGDIVDIYINASNLPAGTYLSALGALMSYSKADFEYQNCAFYTDESYDDSGKIVVNIGNPDYQQSELVKIGMTTTDKSIKSAGTVARLRFKALTSNGGEFALVDAYDTLRGYENMLTFVNDDDSRSEADVSGEDLYVDTTPITVSGN